jgi:hypothetical protein
MLLQTKNLILLSATVKSQVFIVVNNDESALLVTNLNQVMFNIYRQTGIKQAVISNVM